MRILAFPQWDKLMSLLRNMARQSAADYAQRKIRRIIPKNGVSPRLVNNAVNLLAIEGGTTTIIMQVLVSSKAHDFMLSINKLNVTAKYNRGKIGTMPKSSNLSATSRFMV